MIFTNLKSYCVNKSKTEKIIKSLVSSYTKCSEGDIALTHNYNIKKEVNIQ